MTKQALQPKWQLKININVYTFFLVTQRPKTFCQVENVSIFFFFFPKKSLSLILVNYTQLDKS